MEKTVIAFGTELCDCIDERRWKDIPKAYGEFKVYNFKTEAEKQAYMQGLEDANGWEATWTLDKSEEKAVSKYIKSKLSTE